MTYGNGTRKMEVANIMRLVLLAFMSSSLLLTLTTIQNVNGFSGTANAQGWIDTYDLDGCTFSANGSNDYFFLEPGYQLRLEGEEDREPIVLLITVLNETKMVDGVETRVVEERETDDGELVEVSRNYFAICTPENDIFYFGEDVDMYDEGKLESHEGAWLAGVNDARPGVIIPANPKVGDKYYQEVAESIAEDRAQILSLNATLQTPAGDFEGVLRVEETTPLEPGIKEYKLHAKGVGLVQDGPLVLVNYVIPEAEEQPTSAPLVPITQSINLAGKTFELDLMSNSSISEFELDEENRSVNFKVNGQAGTIGVTEIPIGMILEGPYNVAIDGQSTTDFEIVEGDAPDDTFLRISYTHGAGDLTVSGTRVVPEFGQIFFAILVVTIAGTVAWSRIMKK
jgi:hypothetical protein